MGAGSSGAWEEGCGSGPPPSPPKCSEIHAHGGSPKGCSGPRPGCAVGAEEEVPGVKRDTGILAFKSVLRPILTLDPNISVPHPGLFTGPDQNLQGVPKGAQRVNAGPGVSCCSSPSSLPSLRPATYVAPQLSMLLSPLDNSDPTLLPKTLRLLVGIITLLFNHNTTDPHNRACAVAWMWNITQGPKC